MFFGLTVSLGMLIVLGVLLFILLAVQTLIGLRVIKLGKVHRVWHRRLAFALVALAALHGLSAIAFYFGWHVI